jgi:penicillin-binding protein 1A
MTILPESDDKTMFRRILTYMGLGAAALVVLGIGAGVAYLLTVTSGLPSVDSLRHYEPRITTRVYAGNGTVLGEYARERRIFVPIEFVPNRVKQAFTSAEDRNFYNHPGVDPSGILRAAIKDVSLVIQRRRPQGASTITQQVARIFLLNSDLKFSRKIREAILAVRIDATYPKDKVLELYLNEIYLGGNSYGVGAAALNYFGKSLDDLSIEEVAFLAALPKGPANYDPRRYHAAAVERRNWVIDQMAENRHITSEEAQKAKAAPLEAQSRPMGSQAADVDYYVEQVRRQLYTRYGQNALYDGGLQVRASLDTRLQNFAVSALRSGLVRYDRRHGWRGAKQRMDITGDWKTALAKRPNQSGIETWRLAVALGTDAKAIRIGFGDGTTGIIPVEGWRWARRQIGSGWGATPTGPQDVAKAGDLFYVEPIDPKDGGKPGQFGLRQVPEINGAIVVMDPHTGRVLAMSGGFSYASSEFDRAMQAMRQPGSTFKPFVYAAALDNGYTPATRVLDAPFELDMGPGQGIWRPENFEVGEYLGEATLRRGLELSHNLMTVRLAWQLGMDKVAPLAERMGVYNKMPHFLANSLGSQDTTLMRMVTAYAEFVNGGKKIQPSLVDRIQDRQGKTIWRHDARKCEGCNVANWTNQTEPLLADLREQVIDSRTAYQVVSMLEGVVQRGTGVSLRVIGKPVAGKTGTSNEARNLWFVGFSPDLVAGVYVGFDNNRSLGRSEQAAHVAAPIFRDFMLEALKDSPAIPFRVAPGIELVSIDRMTGSAASGPGSIVEAFKSGTAPGDYFGPEPFEQAPSQAAAGTAASQQSGPPASVGEGTGGLY